MKLYLIVTGYLLAVTSLFIAIQSTVGSRDTCQDERGAVRIITAPTDNRDSMWDHFDLKRLIERIEKKDPVSEDADGWLEQWA